jgi:hypothetical protein
MARMSREFQLVLLGAGILTAGSFLWPDPDLVEVAEKNARDPNSEGTSSSGRRHRMGYVMFIHSRSAPSRTFTSGATVRSGGFGGSGARFSGGG